MATSIPSPLSPRTATTTYVSDDNSASFVLSPHKDIPSMLEPNDSLAQFSTCSDIAAAAAAAHAAWQAGNGQQQLLTVSQEMLSQSLQQLQQPTSSLQTASQESFSRLQLPSQQSLQQQSLQQQSLQQQPPSTQQRQLVSLDVARLVVSLDDLVDDLESNSENNDDDIAGEVEDPQQSDPNKDQDVQLQVPARATCDGPVACESKDFIHNSCAASNDNDDDTTDRPAAFHTEETLLSHRDLVSFDGSEDLCRGIRLARVMQGWANLFRSSRGTASTYQLSQHVESIGYFISHNWCVDRRLKLMALTFMFNMRLAVMVSGIFMILGCILGAMGMLPTIHQHGYDYPTGYLARILIMPILAVTLMFGGHIVALVFPSRDPVVFLDKACIHQEDKELQKNGIKKLGAFMGVSDRMLVLLSKVYLRKLWTVYEVASFLSLHDTSRLDVVPLMLPFAFFLYLIFAYCYHLMVMIALAIGFPRWSLSIANAFGSIFLISCLRLWARYKVEIEDSIANFSVHAAECTVESDRDIVYQNVAVLQKACGRVPRNASLEQALEAFNNHVRTTLLAEFKAVFGNANFRLSEYIVISMASFMVLHVDYWAQVGGGQPLGEAIRERCLDPFVDLFVVPLWALCCEAISCRCLWLRANGPLDWLYILWTNIVVSAWGMVMQQVKVFVAGKAEDSDAWFIGAMSVQAVAILATFYFMRRVASRHRTDETLPTQASRGLAGAIP